MRIDYRVDGTSDWLAPATRSLAENGFAVVERLFEEHLCRDAARRMLEVRELLFRELKQKQLEAAVDFPVVPLLPHYDPFFVQFLENEGLAQITSQWLGADCVLRNQYGMLVTPVEPEEDGASAMGDYHRQFRFIPNTTGICFDMAIYLSAVEMHKGPIYMVPGSHVWSERLSAAALQELEVDVTAPCGSVLLFDGMTWHREERNYSNELLPLLMQEFVNPVIKQYWDYPRILNQSFADGLTPQVRKLFGFVDRVPASLEDFFERNMQPEKAATVPKR